MTAFFKSSFCTDRPENEQKGTLSLECYNPLSKEVQKKIKDAKTNALMNAALDQAPQHCNKKNTNIHCLYYVKDGDAISNIVKNYATEMVHYSNMELKKGTQYNPNGLSTITRALHLLIMYLKDANFEAWRLHFIFDYLHLNCSLINKIATLVAVFHKACVSPETVAEAMKGNPPGSDSAFAHAIRDILQFINELESYVKSMHIGAFTVPNTTLLYVIHYLLPTATTTAASNVASVNLQSTATAAATANFCQPTPAGTTIPTTPASH